MSELDTIPGVISVGSNEIATFNFDVTAVLGTGESLQSNPAPTASLVFASNYTAVSNPFIGAPGVSGNRVQGYGHVLQLQLKHSLFKIVSYYTTATKTLQFRTQINVVV